MTTIQGAPDSLESAVLEALRAITVGEGGPDVVAEGHVAAVVATAGAVRVLLDPQVAASEDGEALAGIMREVVAMVPGVTRVIVKPRPQSITPILAQAPGTVLAVHSGKGGVGKSTLAVNLAAALANGAAGRPLRVGLLDADVYGPSAPLLLGLKGRAEATTDANRIIPMQAHGLKVMSLGFLMPEGKALAWRGSLVSEGLPQLIADVEWGELDLLVVDLPPGTSDVHLALAQAVPVAGVVAVTAPGQISTDDVRRGLEMFADIAVPCLGLIENMSTVTCRKCGAETALFGADGGADLERETGLPLLARIPFLREVLLASQAGTPMVLAQPDAPYSRTISALAKRLAGDLAQHMKGEVKWQQ